LQHTLVLLVHYLSKHFSIVSKFQYEICDTFLQDFIHTNYREFTLVNKINSIPVSDFSAFWTRRTANYDLLRLVCGRDKISTFKFYRVVYRNTLKVS